MYFFKIVFSFVHTQRYGKLSDKLEATSNKEIIDKLEFNKLTLTVLSKTMSGEWEDSYWLREDIWKKKKNTIWRTVIENVPKNS